MGLYIQMFSVHGLVRHDNPELGRDADTGGQIKYVIELAESLSQCSNVDQIDVFTRRIIDKTVSSSYSEEIEQINDKYRIVRIQCGGNKYLRKETLWNHLDEFIDKSIKYMKAQKRLPDIVHGHYADAGYVGMCIAQIFGIPFVFTGHSLGRSKKEKLIADGLSEDDINLKFKIQQRIQAEEDVIKSADLIITSTSQEKSKQYGLYKNSANAKFCVVPPGININQFTPYYHEEQVEEKMQARNSMVHELNRFLVHPEKPLILTLCRPAKKKNIAGLIEAYGEDKELQAMANLAVFAGIRKDISMKQEDEKDVLTEMLLLMDKYDLYGKMAIPKKHDFSYEVPELYRIAANSGGVFVNAALIEPFGLTLIEASACGLPIVATEDGGPRDIVANCKNGLLVNVENTAKMSRKIKKIISDTSLWKEYSNSGINNVRRTYTWDAHVETYLKHVQSLSEHNTRTIYKLTDNQSVGKRFKDLKAFFFTDIDNTLIGDKESMLQLMSLINEKRSEFGFGLATGRTIESTMDVLKEYGISMPDVIITSVGASIYYGKMDSVDRGWMSHISNKWNRDKIKSLLEDFSFLSYQKDNTQKSHKISYNIDDHAEEYIPLIHDRLIKNKVRYNLVFSHEHFIDILPYRASKGKAIRYLSYKWGIPLDHIIVCGDSGNDIEMLKGEMLGVVVANYSKELEKLRGMRKIYFSEKKYAAGIIEGFQHYDFFEYIKM